MKEIYNNGNYKITAEKNGVTVSIKAINRMEDTISTILLTQSDVLEILSMFQEQQLVDDLQRLYVSSTGIGYSA